MSLFANLRTLIQRIFSSPKTSDEEVTIRFEPEDPENTVIDLEDTENTILERETSTVEPREAENDELKADLKSDEDTEEHRHSKLENSSEELDQERPNTLNPELILKYSGTRKSNDSENTVYIKSSQIKHLLESSDSSASGLNEDDSNTPGLPLGWLVVVSGPNFGVSKVITEFKSGIPYEFFVDEEAVNASAPSEMIVDIHFDRVEKNYTITLPEKVSATIEGNQVSGNAPLHDRTTISIGDSQVMFIALCGSDFCWQ